MSIFLLLSLLFLRASCLILSLKSLLAVLRRRKHLVLLRVNPQEMPFYPKQPLDLAPNLVS